MPKYLIKGTYGSAAVTEVVATGAAARLAAVTAGLEQLGGSLDGLYWGFGGADAYIIADLPDDAAAHAMLLAACRGSGTATATRLMDASELDETISRGAAFRSPGTE